MLTKLRRWLGGLVPLGQQGERAAARYLRRQGLQCLQRNYRVRTGEIDLIMTEGETVIFVEVKARRDESYVSGETLVNRAKQRRLESAARCFLQMHGWHDRPCRFDVVVVIKPDQGDIEFRHYPHAFRVKR